MHPDPSDASEATGAPSSDERVAAALRGFGPLGLLAILAVLFTGNVFIGTVVLPVGAVLVLIWARWSRTPWRALGFVRPKSWMSTIAAGVVLGVALKLTMKALVMPLLGAEPVNPVFRQWTGNAAAMPAAIWAMFVAGFGEEVVFRGWLFERLGRLLGTQAIRTALIIVVTSTWFGLAHYSLQGLSGVQQATIVGLVFGTIFAMTGQLVVLMIAHTAFDLTALALIFWNLETAVARLIFKS